MSKSDSGSEYETDREIEEPVPKRNANYKWRKQKFNKDWLNNSIFRGWLEECDDIYKCKCSLCNITLVCGKSELVKHAESKKHKTKVSTIKTNNNNINNYFKPKEIKDDLQVKNFEIRLSTFFAEHNVAFEVVEHLVPLLKEIIPDSNILQHVTLGRKKCTSIVKNVIAENEKQNLIETLKCTKFSLLIDESTDLTLNKTMCVVARYVHPLSGTVCTALLDLIKLDAKDCSAEKLYSALTDLLKSVDIPLENVIGLASDGASVMVGEKNSVTSRFLQDNKNLIHMKCICHSAALVANKACMTLPRGPEDLLRQVTTYLSGSSKRCSQLEEFQEFFNMKKKQLLKTSNTRWLSLQKCVARFIECWDVLLHYFKVAMVEDKLRSAELIFNELNNLCTKAYLYFLKYVLTYFNILNALFQSSKPLVQELYSESRKLFLKLGQNCIKPECLKSDMIIRHAYNYLKLEDVFVGAECAAILEQLPENERQMIKKHCLEFYIVSLEQIQMRLPINEKNNLFCELKFLQPAVGLEKDADRNINFDLLLEKCTELNKNELTYEWRTMPYHFNETERENMLKLSVEEFWFQIGKVKNYSDEYVFPNLSKLANHMLSIPHSNADSEKIFSVVTDVRTKKRNKLSHEVLNSICIIRSSFSSTNTNCLNFKCNTNHFKLSQYKSLYDHKK